MGPEKRICEVLLGIVACLPDGCLFTKISTSYFSFSPSQSALMLVHRQDQLCPKPLMHIVGVPMERQFAGFPEWLDHHQASSPHLQKKFCRTFSFQVKLGFFHAALTAPAPNRVGNGVWTRPHAPFENRRVSSISATRPGRSHAQPRARGGSTRPHAPGRGCTRSHAQGGVPTHRADAPTRSHAQGRKVHAQLTRQGGAMCAPNQHPIQPWDWFLEILLLFERNSKGCSFDASGGILRVSKGNKEMLWGKKTGGLYQLEGNVQTGGATVRHGSSGISERRVDKGSNRCTEVRKASAGVLRGSVMVLGGSGVVQECREMLWDMYGSLARHEWEERWSHDNSQSDVLCGAPRGGWGAPQWGGAGHLGEKVQALRCGGAYTSVGSGVAR
ncbi:hypothetical protein Acr_22g0000080 [Actinidia rufa]|uniref:Uncharacterized protein n=1 Tax=Actinidia rufa TaxID=165716 RepID=A0A7J0GIG9_9ERIC|nr:hypothetical protein Acr_22g0000080 [Actinidia rufa]